MSGPGPSSGELEALSDEIVATGIGPDDLKKLCSPSQPELYEAFHIVVRKQHAREFWMALCELTKKKDSNDAP
jgi:hypothetical protein